MVTNTVVLMVAAEERKRAMWCNESDLEILSPIFSSGYIKIGRKGFGSGNESVKGESESYAFALHVSSRQNYDIRVAVTWYKVN
jgi:hypothetical protein